MGRRARRRAAGFGLFDQDSSVDVDTDDLDEEDLDNEEDDDEEPDQDILDKDGGLKMEVLLAHLLSALGIKVDASGGAKEFKKSLYKAAMKKVAELTGKGNGKSGNGKKSTTNPLLKGPSVNGELLQEEQGPMMSLARIANLADPNAQRIALSLADQNVGLRAARAATARTQARGMEDWIAQATATRQRRIALLSATGPGVKAELDAMLGRPDMALSLDANGAIVDRMAATLATLEHALGDKVPKSLPNDLPANQSQTDLDRVADILARRMGAR